MVNIGKIVYSKLRGLAGNRLFPLIADQGTECPFMVYRREVGLPSDTKDRFSYRLRNTVEIKIVTEKYDEGVELAAKVFDMFDNMREQEVDGIQVVQTRVQSLSESWSDNMFVQTVTVVIDTR